MRSLERTRAAATRATSAWPPLIALSVLVTACGSSSSDDAAASAVTASIGPEGGSLAAPDGTRVDVPAGALPASSTLTLAPAANVPPPSGASFVSSAWTLEPVWLRFAKPVTVTLAVDPSRLAAGASLDSLVVLTTATGVTGYVALAARGVDDTHVEAQTTHFATGGAATADCTVTCADAVDALGDARSCAATCVGHQYLLSCDGPRASASCTCAIDGVVTDATSVATGDAGVDPATYVSTCGFPATAWSGPGSPSTDSGTE